MATNTPAKRGSRFLKPLAWIAGSVLVVGGIVGGSYAVNRLLTRGLPRWRYCITSLGGVGAETGYMITVTDPSGNAGTLIPRETDGSYILKSWWAARNHARGYIMCRGGVPVAGSGPCGDAPELTDPCATE